MSAMRHIDEQVAGRALDALPPAEAAQVDQHVAVCPTCHQVLRDAQETAHLLMLVVQPVRPPHHCLVWVMEHIARDAFR